MKPFENWNQKSLVLIGASLGAGVLLLLAAVPSQTDFDGTYFKTNSLPISLTGYLTNWAKLDTNASGGDTIWTTNADGVISPVGTGQLTNVLRFTSGLADNATNLAVELNTAVPWNLNASILAIKKPTSADTNWFSINQEGRIQIGPFTTGDGFAADDIHIRRVEDLGDGATSIYGDYIRSDNTLMGWFFAADSGSSSMGLDWNSQVDVLIGISTNQTYISMTAPSTVLLIQPTIADGSTPYQFNTALAHTSGMLFDVKNDGTNKFSVVYNGSITTGGNTNRWIFKDYPNVNVDGANHSLGGGDTIWTTNADGIIQPLGTGQLTNMLRFTSGFSDGATNLAALIDTANLWTGETNRLLSIRNNHIERLAVFENGEIVQGRNAIEKMHTLPYEGVSIFSWYDPALGDVNGNEWFGAVGNEIDVDSSWDFYATKSSVDFAFASYDWVANNGCNIQGSVTTNRARFEIVGIIYEVILEPTIADGSTPFKFASDNAHTEGTLLTVSNQSTEEFAILHNGAITTGGNTNRWIFKGLTVDGGVTNAHCTVNGTNFFWELKPE